MNNFDVKKMLETLDFSVDQSVQFRKILLSLKTSETLFQKSFQKKWIEKNTKFLESINCSPLRADVFFECLDRAVVRFNKNPEMTFEQLVSSLETVPEPMKFVGVCLTFGIFKYQEGKLTLI
jgi:hypothetical protein